MDKKVKGGDIIPRKSKGKKTKSSVEAEKTAITLDAGKPTGSTKPGIHCIGEICFTDDGFVVKIPEDANPECAKRVAEDILSGKANIKYEISPKALVAQQGKNPESGD